MELSQLLENLELTYSKLILDRLNSRWAVKAYAMISNTENRSKFNFNVACLRNSKDKEN